MIIISPAKSLIKKGDLPQYSWTMPRLLEQSERIQQALKKKSVKKLMDLQSISNDLASVNFERNQAWTVEHSLENARPAIFTFDGDVYKGLSIETWEDEIFDKAQQKLRILSGLYGLLRPHDLIHLYRLEMGTKLSTTRGKNLYQFWGNRITTLLLQDMEEANSQVLFNLASNEYAKGVQMKSLNVPIIEPVFKDWSNGKYKVVSFFAKRARGLMARYLIENEINDLDGVNGFQAEGYELNNELSSGNKPVFTRIQKK